MPGDWRRAAFALLFAGPVAQAADDAPTDEFELFDFIGVMVEQEGEWVDPIDMEGADVPEGENGPTTSVSPADVPAAAGEEP